MTMKRIIIVAVMAVMGLQMQAQIVSSRSAITTITREVRGWSTFGIEYLPSNFNNDGHSTSFTGLALNYTNATALSSSVPLFFELGIGAQYSSCSKDDVDIKFVSAKVPLNLIYDYQIPNTRINLDPYVGLRLRGNVWGELKNDYYDETYDLFDSDEGDCKRFQVGWSIGLKARINNAFFVGIGYGSDFSEFTEDTKISEVSLSLGLVF